MEKKKPESTSAVHSSTPDRLRDLLSLSEKSPSTWRMGDSSDILRHQLAAELVFDLGREKPTLPAARAEQHELDQARAVGIRTFKDLFTNPNPPVKVLKICSEFFKNLAKKTPKNSPENEVAHVCYYLSVVVARLRLDQRISSLTDTQLLQGLKWSLKRDWLDQNTKAILEDGTRAMK